MSEPHDERPSDPRIGLCQHCGNARVVESAKAQRFWQCRAAEGRGDMLKYPPLPVLRCPAFEAGEPLGG